MSSRSSLGASASPDRVRATVGALTREGFRFLTTPAMVPEAAQLIGGQAVSTGEASYVLTAGFSVDFAGALVMADCYTSGRPDDEVTVRFLTLCASVTDQDAAVAWVRTGLQTQLFETQVFGPAIYRLTPTNRDNARLVVESA